MTEQKTTAATTVQTVTIPPINPFSGNTALINTLCVVIPLLLAALGAIIAIVIVRSRKKLNEEDTSYHEIPPLNRNTDNPNDHNHMS